MTRRQIQVVLGVLWLLDGALQLQPFMLGRGFAREIIAPAGDGQPWFVSSSVHWAADMIASQPVVWDVAFAFVQLAIGVGLLVPRTARTALAASLGWSVGVWFFGEGLGGLASGHADLLTGAPGAVLLYAVLALGAWPPSGRKDERPAAWLPIAWAVCWLGGAALLLLPDQNSISDVVATLRDNADGAPSWLAQLDHHMASMLTASGTAGLVALVVAQAVIGLAAIRHGAARTAAGTAGIVVSGLFWVFGQSLGELWTGQATDPNTAPLMMLFALAMMASPAASTVLSRGRPRQEPSHRSGSSVGLPRSMPTASPMGTQTGRNTGGLT